MKVITAKDLLTNARSAISDPDHWTQGEMARDKEGQYVSSSSPYAVCWCALGALAAAGIDLADCVESEKVYDAFDKIIGTTQLTHFNDTHAHVVVLDAFDRAIESLEY